ncbi:rhodanese-like domain-containing protein [Lacinutrix undariae]
MSIFSRLFGEKTPQSKAIKVLSPLHFKTKITNNNVQLVDVRTLNEFNTQHINKAINIDFFSNNFQEKFNKLNKDQAVYIYCRSGGRSRKASNKLATLGFLEIYDLQGGLLNYK